MATLPITDLLAELEILASQMLDFAAQLDHFPARVLDWVNQFRGGSRSDNRPVPVGRS